MVFDEDEDARLHEIPEINDTIKKMYKIKHKPLTANKLNKMRLQFTKGKTPNVDSLSDTSDNKREVPHNYAERV